MRSAHVVPFMGLLLLFTTSAHAITAGVDLVAIVPTPTSTPMPRKLAIGTDGTLDFGALLQMWGQFDYLKNPTSTFRLRRAEIVLKGDIVPKQVAFKVMFDPAKVLEFQPKAIPVTGDTTKTETVNVSQPVNNTSVLQDIALVFTTGLGDISVGQFKIPVSWEGVNSSSKLLFAERAEVSRKTGDKRDLGLQIAKKSDAWSYTLGVWNGSGLNVIDANNEKDVGLRLEAYPVTGLTLAGVAYGTVGDRDVIGSKDRYEADVRFERGSLIAQAEYIHGRDVAKSGMIDSEGAYAALAWSPIPQLQPCMRVGMYDPNLDKADDDMLHTDLGLTYFVRKHEAKVQLNYSLTQRPKQNNQHNGTVAVQIAF